MNDQTNVNALLQKECREILEKVSSKMPKSIAEHQSSEDETVRKIVDCVVCEEKQKDEEATS